MYRLPAKDRHGAGFDGVWLAALEYSARSTRCRIAGIQHQDPGGALIECRQDKWNVQGGRTDAGDEYDGGYNTFDLRSSYAPMKDLKLSFSINNVFDTDYTVAYGYETPGVNAMLTAAYTF